MTPRGGPLSTACAGLSPGACRFADAEDVLQDTLLRLHEASDSLRDADRAEAWVFSIARRTIADFYRERERGPERPIPTMPRTRRRAAK